MKKQIKFTKVNIEENSQRQFREDWIKNEKKYIKQMEKEEKLWSIKISAKERLDTTRDIMGVKFEMQK